MVGRTSMHPSAPGQPDQRDSGNGAQAYGQPVEPTAVPMGIPSGLYRKEQVSSVIPSLRS